MIAKSIGVPMFRQDIDLGYSCDQAAMAHIFHEPDNRDSVLYQPRHWYNTYDHHLWGYEGKKGDLLVHFPGLPNNTRHELMSHWLDDVETHPQRFEMDLENTTYIQEISSYWALLREAKSTLRSVEQHESNVSEITSNKTIAIERLRTLLWEGTDELKEIKRTVEDLQKLYN